MTTNMQNKTIMVREALSGLRIIIGIFLVLCTLPICLIAIRFIIEGLNDFRLVIFLIFAVLIGMPVISILAVARTPKVAVTPLLVISESGMGDSEGAKAAQFAIASSTGLLGYLGFAHMASIKYTLCKEGVITRGGSLMGGRLIRWNSFRSFTIDSDKKQIKLKIHWTTILLQSRERFDEVAQIVSEYIPIKI